MQTTTATAPTVREFSICGPCLPLGTLVRETTKFYVFVTDRQAEKKVAKLAKYASEISIHIAPCSRCEDHPKTGYPHGYMD